MESRMIVLSMKLQAGNSILLACREISFLVRPETYIIIEKLN